MTDAPVIFGLTGRDIEKLAKDGARDAQAESRGKGLPVVTEVDGNIVIEHPDGRKEVRKPTAQGR